MASTTFSGPVTSQNGFIGNVTGTVTGTVVQPVSAVAAAGTNSAVAVALKLQQGDTTSSYADVSGYVGGTDFTVPTPDDTNSTSVVRFNVDMRGKKRYLNVYATPNAASPVVSVARLGKPEEAPVAAAAAGVDVFVSG